MVIMYYKIYKEAVRQREALSKASSNPVLNTVHQHRISTLRSHSRTSHQLLLQAQETGEYTKPTYKTAIELNIENGEFFSSPFLSHFQQHFFLKCHRSLER